MTLKEIGKIYPGGEIGRRTALRWQHQKWHAGSNPVLGTNNRHYLKTFSFRFHIKDGSFFI